MAEKRKDNKGRILKTGESQRKDLTYMYRYTDLSGKRKYVYARTLQELREKEDEIQQDLFSGINHSAGEISVSDYVNKQAELKRGARYGTKRAFRNTASLLEEDALGSKRMNQVKQSDARLWILQLHERGYKYNSVANIVYVMKAVFNTAIDEDIVRKNPFSFKLTDVIPKDLVDSGAVSREDIKKYLEFLESNCVYRKIYDEVVILIGTGLRISELYGLTISDIDFEKKRIRVGRQLQRDYGGIYCVAEPKTESGNRFVPMSPDVEGAFRRAIANRNPKIEHIINGFTGFIFMNRRGMPKLAGDLDRQMSRSIERYNEDHEEKLPRITPHMLRHTFCTEMAMEGMNVKTLQYIMGHSSISTTLNIYTHVAFDQVESSFNEVVEKREGLAE